MWVLTKVVGAKRLIDRVGHDEIIPVYPDEGTAADAARAMNRHNPGFRYMAANLHLVVNALDDVDQSKLRCVETGAYKFDIEEEREIQAELDAERAGCDPARVYGYNFD